MMAPDLFFIVNHGTEICEYNDTPHSVISFTPAYLFNGYSSRLIPDTLTDLPDLKADRKTAYEKSIANRNYNKLRYDRNKTDDVSLGDA